jgi:hypothetical protein
MAWLAGTLTYAKTRKRRRRRTWTDDEMGTMPGREGGREEDNDIWMEGMENSNFGELFLWPTPQAVVEIWELKRTTM